MEEFSDEAAAFVGVVCTLEIPSVWSWLSAE
jgi:hypothetical protein